MILKLSVLNNINIKNKTWIKFVNIASLKSSSPGPLESFPLSFLVSEKVIRSVDPLSTKFD